jgi:hypothetical protein
MTLFSKKYPPRHKALYIKYINNKYKDIRIPVFFDGDIFYYMSYTDERFIVEKSYYNDDLWVWELNHNPVKVDI